MEVKVLEVQCCNCGATVTPDTEICEYCVQPVTISTFNSVSQMEMPSINNYIRSYRKNLASDPSDMSANKAMAYCYLKLKMYDEALSFFEKAIIDNFDDSEVYFYAAVCCLKGKKAFLAQRADINKIEEYINAATRIEPRGIYYYFGAYIKYDYYKRKFLNVTPDYTEMLGVANKYKYSSYDVAELFKLLGVENPFEG